MSDRKSFVLDIRSSSGNQLIDITSEVSEKISDSGVKNGICHIYVPHTTAAVTINENADPDVAIDILAGLDDIVSDKLEYRHSEGNSPAHIKSSLLGIQEQVLIENGRMVLGTWQGIYFCEFDGPRSRKIHVKVIGG